MDLEATVAAPFKREGRARLGEGEFVVALSLDRDWFSPDQAKRLVDVAVGEGLLAREADDLVAQFDPGNVAVPDDGEPGEDVLRRRSPFERVVAALVAAGHDKREAVAAINELQGELAVSVEAAAVLYARREGVDVGGALDVVRQELLGDGAESADGDPDDADSAGDDAGGPAAGSAGDPDDAGAGAGGATPD